MIGRIDRAFRHSRRPMAYLFRNRAYKEMAIYIMGDGDAAMRAMRTTGNRIGTELMPYGLTGPEVRP
jgi:hypothetical protein